MEETDIIDLDAWSCSHHRYFVVFFLLCIRDSLDKMYLSAKDFEQRANSIPISTVSERDEVNTKDYNEGSDEPTSVELFF
jgi:hypothetical protein